MGCGVGAGAEGLLRAQARQGLCPGLPVGPADAGQRKAALKCAFGWGGATGGLVPVERLEREAAECPVRPSTRGGPGSRFPAFSFSSDNVLKHRVDAVT